MKPEIQYTKNKFKCAFCANETKMLYALEGYFKIYPDEDVSKAKIGLPLCMNCAMVAFDSM